MTLKQFLARLRKTPRRWKLRAGVIRQQGACPITSIVGMKSAQQVVSVRRLLGINESLSSTIVLASDNWPYLLTAHERRVRSQLLKACGLKEAK